MEQQEVKFAYMSYVLVTPQKTHVETQNMNMILFDKMESYTQKPNRKGNFYRICLNENIGALGLQ